MKTMTESAYKDEMVNILSSKRWTRIIDTLRPNGVFVLNGMEEPFAELILEDKDIYIENAEYIDNNSILLIPELDNITKTSFYL